VLAPIGIRLFVLVVTTMIGSRPTRQPEVSSDIAAHSRK
jgi:hypothetical protein